MLKMYMFYVANNKGFLLVIATIIAVAIASNMRIFQVMCLLVCTCSITRFIVDPYHKPLWWFMIA